MENKNGKLLSIALAAVLSVSLTACGGNSSSEETTEENTTAASEGIVIGTDSPDSEEHAAVIEWD